MANSQPLQDLTKLINEIENLKGLVDSIKAEKQTFKKALDESFEITKALTEKNVELEGQIHTLNSEKFSARDANQFDEMWHERSLNEIKWLKGIVDNFSKGGQHVNN